MKQITTLMPMTQFVLSMFEDYLNGFYSLTSYQQTLVSYAKFLQRPLELGFFIPCKDGAPMVEPIMLMFDEDGYDTASYQMALIDYEAAKSKCLFEGFTVIAYEEKNYEVEMTGKNIWLTFIKNEVEIIDFDGSETIITNVEQFMQYCLDRSIEVKLTPTVIKEIYGR